ncbi:hypothetical protein HanXRQr2_Chr15g0697171 [Helianthus annuus]|uniref:Uncharacterized protein n=1 Tax=Helianthus annuus TaxID=4232 RepID=A0A9K3E253_HELAN|nr:hypothetical protein HanXRQr2_Chr15g0697171 [Helianthus annuus]KAJ0831604.1 hypothetical protein HanPSC8_Chr15g0668941 [Helianthus annuus]
MQKTIRIEIASLTKERGLPISSSPSAATTTSKSLIQSGLNSVVFHTNCEFITNPDHSNFLGNTTAISPI